MEISYHLIDAARETIKAEYRVGELLRIKEYPGMFVEETGGGPGRQISAIHFFSVGDLRFALGSMLTSSGQLND